MLKIIPVLLLILTLPLAASSQKAELIRHTVLADDHPLALWEKSAENATEAILLIHGRTWSALPDFDLQVEGEDLSLMDGLVENGYAVFALDMRGYGETPRDETEWLTPNRAADDVAITAVWIADHRAWRIKPHLFGWSMGSGISQLSVQRHPEYYASLTLFGYWRDLDVELSADKSDLVPQKKANTAEAAASDFITPGSISARAVDAFVATALKADPIRVDVKSREDYNALDESQIIIPTLVIAGEFDPIAPAKYQTKLLNALGTGHKQYVSVPDGDHAAFLETPRAYFIHELVAFLRGVSL